ncbi:DedA family protein [Clostridium sp. 19966]|uniref:DedA family protein n=1 Tax=Clostridium sp. 19966 TaxID=2768166 RepID=UPI0028DF33AA|nr:DedA family protein [Clostridium sp. 19966]MDT8718750.1 DedA family protein [Clostridium sp. 19966]
MNVISYLFDFVMHIDKHLSLLIGQYGVLVYVMLFLIVFCETGLVVTPFLPGDSMIFAAGTFAGIGDLHIAILFFSLWAAAILGNIVNYSIGRKIGPKITGKENPKFIKKEYLDKTHAFYDRYGGLTIIITRFMPIIRTFAPFVAGLGEMKYSKFFLFNLIGGTLWVSLFAFGGYFIGNNAFVKAHFTEVIYAILIISLLPAFIGALKAKFGKTKKAA